MSIRNSNTGERGQRCHPDPHPQILKSLLHRLRSFTGRGFGIPFSSLTEIRDPWPSTVPSKHQIKM
uniref:Uncharacterized protein n=1 Tax=Rhizophora mucronata TaxID=61149 RepID=A0A2P2NGL2_RHIMU